ncbi:uncharacterized protein [Branchiostoma lanceolatum]|uniref:uncharacterized protein n=1 Tax=Branchiostoma lanceolatum TaxID=7740 RepID=UPI0034553C1F
MFTRSFIRRLSPLVRHHSTYREGRWSKYGTAAGAAISTGASLVAIYSAYDSRKNLEAHKRKEFGRAFAELQDDYYTSDMHHAMRMLYTLKKRAEMEGRSWDDVCGEWAADDLTFALTPAGKPSVEKQVRLKEVEDIEEARRKWSAFYNKFRSLFKRGVISEEDVKQYHFPSDTQMKGYISVVDAIEHAGSVIFVGNDEKYIANYTDEKVAGFLDTTFLDGSVAPSKEKLLERNEKYLQLRKEVMENVKATTSKKGHGGK